MVADQNSAWSIGLGRWLGVNVRMHMLFFVFAVLTFYFGWQASLGVSTSEYYLTAFVALGILFASIFVHEVAHGFTATGFGGSVDSIEIFPWGGTSEIELPPNKHHQFLTHVSGPLTNFVICLTCAGILLFDPLFASNGSWANLLHPLKPVVLKDNLFGNIVGLIFWVNWLVFLINLLPVNPFDGGKIVRSLIPLFWPNTRTDQVYLGSMIVAMMTSIGLCVVAWLSRESQVETIVPMWLVLLLMAIVVFFGARRQTQLDLRDLEELLDNETGVYADKILEAIENRAFDEFDDEQEDDQQISDWLYQHKFEKDEESSVDEIFDNSNSDRKTDEEQIDDEQVDKILDKINQVGVDGLSEQERILLMRISAQYRKRKKQSDMTR